MKARLYPVRNASKLKLSNACTALDPAVCKGDAKEKNKLGCLLHGLAVHTDKIPTERSWETDQFQNIPHTDQPYIYTLLSASHAAPIGLPNSAKMSIPIQDNASTLKDLHMVYSSFS